MAAKKTSTVAAQTETTSTVVGINILRMVMDNLNVAKDHLANITVDLQLLDDETQIAAVSLAENIILIGNAVDNHLVTVVKSKKASGMDAKNQLGDITIELLIKKLDESVKLIESIKEFGNTVLSVQSMKSIRLASEKIKDEAGSIRIAQKLYEVRSKI